MKESLVAELRRLQRWHEAEGDRASVELLDRTCAALTRMPEAVTSEDVSPAERAEA